MTNPKELRDRLKTLSKLRQQLHMYNPDQLRNALKIAVTYAREATEAQMQSAEGDRIARPENEAQGGWDKVLQAENERLREVLAKWQDKALGYLEDNVRLRAVLFCKHPGCNGTGTIDYKVYDGRIETAKPCPTCGPIRKTLKEE